MAKIRANSGLFAAIVVVVALTTAVLACGTPPGVTRMNAPAPVVSVPTETQVVVVPTVELPTPIVVLPTATLIPTETYTSTPSATPVPPTATQVFTATASEFAAVDDEFTVGEVATDIPTSTVTSDTTCAAWDVDDVLTFNVGETFDNRLTCQNNIKWYQFPTNYDFLPVVAKDQQELPGGWILAREAADKGQTSDPYLPWSFVQQFSASRDIAYAEAHWAHPTLFAINPTETFTGKFVIRRLTLEAAQKIAANEGGTIANDPYDNQRMGKSMVAIFIGGRGIVTVKKGNTVLYDNLAIRLTPCTTCKGYTKGTGPLDWSGNDGEPDPSAHYGKVNLIIPFERDLTEDITIEFAVERLPRRSGEPGVLYWWFGAYEPPA